MIKNLNFTEKDADSLDMQDVQKLVRTYFDYEIGKEIFVLECQGHDIKKIPFYNNFRLNKIRQQRQWRQKKK